MFSALEQLKQEVCQLHDPVLLSDTTWDQYAAQCVVVLMTGGESSRFRSVPGSAGYNKNALELPNGDSMIEMTIRMYAAAGIKRFVALVYHQSETVIDRLGDGSSLGVTVIYSHDPQQPVGKGGAVRNALDNGSIPEDAFIIVHNPDDVILDFEGSFPRYIFSGHIEGMQAGAVATTVVVPETPYTYSAMKVVDNKVTECAMYPQIPIPTHIGVTIFSPACYPLFRDLFDLTKKMDFEQVLLPQLANSGQLWAVGIESEHWLAVNTLKAYKQLLQRLDINV